jgi:hypothetical protein
VETFAETLVECGVKATRLPYEPNLQSLPWEFPYRELLLVVSREAQAAKPVLRKYSIW